MIKIIPSITCANPLCYGEEIRRLGDCPYLHIDIEDGNFIPNITFGMKSIRAVASVTKARMDAHLMTTYPDDYIDDLAALGVSAICFHIECAPYPLQYINKIKALGMRAGLAVNLKTSLDELKMFAQDIDYLLVMTGEADYGTLDFHGAALERVKQARAMLPDSVELWVDGGVGQAQLGRLVECGADTAVMGRAVFQSPDPAATIKEFEQY